MADYTLEKHLEELKSENKDFEVLYSIWTLNKKNLEKGLNTINSSFPSFSVHDISHSQKLINNIQLFLGDDRIKTLGATDTFLLLMACLTHDIGMILTFEIKKEEWSNPDFKETLEYYKDSSDKVISKAAKRILEFEKSEVKEDYKWALDIQNSVVILTQEIFRKRHAKLGAENLSKYSKIKDLTDEFYANQLPDRYMDLVSKIAYLHGAQKDEILTILSKKANGYSGDYIHPRFIASMVRLGDLLDFDSDRFSPFNSASIEEMPEISKLHEEKHKAVKHMLISPESIEAELDCKSDEVFRAARDWFDWLEEEVEFQSRTWIQIAPENLGGLPPIISKGSIKIKFNGAEVRPELMNIKFKMSQEKIFDILKGGALYKEPGLVFIREIVQNALDASKLQLWNDLKNGRYKNPLMDKGIEDIKFPNDIKSAIYQQYPIRLTTKWKDNKEDILVIECEDEGTGITEDTILHITDNVGESQSKQLSKDENIPYWLKPTAAFGLGLQSIFYVADSFVIETKSEGEKAKRIIFRSPAKSQYCSLEYIEDRIRGTKVHVEISKENLSSHIGHDFGIGEIDNVNVFECEGDNINIAKLDIFVRNQCGGIRYFPFFYKTINESRDITPNTDDIPLYKIEDCSNNDLEINYYYENEDIEFYVYEKIKGSTLFINFPNEIGYIQTFINIALRDIKIQRGFFFHKTVYLYLNWILENQESDKIVDISRDGLTREGMAWVENNLLGNGCVLSTVLNSIKPIFKKIVRDNSKSKTISDKYFNYLMSLMTLNGYQSLDIEPIKDMDLPTRLMTKDKGAVKAKEFFNSECLYLICDPRHSCNTPYSEEQKSIYKKYEDELKNQIIIWAESYFYSMLIYNYYCQKIIYYNNGNTEYIIYKLHRRKSTNSKIFEGPVQVDERDREEFLLTLQYNSKQDCTRRCLYPIEKYVDIAMYNVTISGYERYPSYSNCCIFGPFADDSISKKLLKQVSKLEEEKDIRSSITENFDEYISNSLLNIVYNNRVNKDITKEKIKEGYITLLTDFIYAVRKSEDNVKTGNKKQ